MHDSESVWVAGLINHEPLRQPGQAAKITGGEWSLRAGANLIRYPERHPAQQRRQYFHRKRVNAGYRGRQW